MVTVEEKTFNVEIEENNIEVVPVVIETEVIEVNTSTPGAKGENATINGVNTLEIKAGENIEIEQEEGTLTVNATATPQIQSDLAQEDDTQVDFVKNKKGENIITTLYMYDEDEDEMIPVMEENIDNMVSILYEVIIGIYNEFAYYDEKKQDKITDEEISIEPYEWNNNECRKYISQIDSNDKVWYSPTEQSYDNFVDSEIIMTEVGNGYVDFKCKNTPTQIIGVIIRRAR